LLVVVVVDDDDDGGGGSFSYSFLLLDFHSSTINKVAAFCNLSMEWLLK